MCMCLVSVEIYFFWHSLELWYYTIVILMVGWLKNPEIAVDAISIWLDYATYPFLGIKCQVCINLVEKNIVE